MECIGDYVLVYYGDKLLIRGQLNQSGLYEVVNLKEEEEYVNGVREQQIQLWHKRLGHMSYSGMKSHIDKNRMKLGSLVLEKEDVKVCGSCQKGKFKRKRTRRSNSKSKRILELIHADLMGPINPLSRSGKEYAMVVVDDYSRRRWVIFLKRKEEAAAELIDLLTFLERSTEKKVKTVRTDNGGEFVSDEFGYFCKKNGILHQKTTPYTSTQNGRAERSNGMILDMARTMIIDANLPRSFWAEACSTACYILDRTPSRVIDGKTPMEMWTGEKVGLKDLRVFGCVCYSWIPKRHRSKMENKGLTCIFLGYGTDHKGHRIMDINSGRVMYSKDVVFDEEMHINADVKQHLTMVHEHDGSELYDEGDLKEIEDFKVLDDDGNEIEFKTEYQQEEYDVDKSIYREDFDLVNAVEHKIAEPTTYKEAIESEYSDRWLEAMLNEYGSLIGKHTFDVVDRSSSSNVVSSKWVFKVKYDRNGLPIKFKARIVARGFTQRKGVDYDLIFAPVVRHSSIRIFMKICIERDMLLHQMDVKTAFLNALIDHEVFVEPPEGIRESTCGIWKLRKALYGLKQSQRNWNEMINDVLIELGFTRGISDTCIYRRSHKGNLSLVLIYVDDIMIATDQKEDMIQIKAGLGAYFEMSDMDELRFCLGLQVERGNDWIWLGQSTYIDDVVERFNLEQATVRSTPMKCGNILSKAMAPDTLEEKIEMDKIPYRKGIGSVMYAMIGSRPDVAYSLSELSKYLDNPGARHWKEFKHLVRYLKGSKDFGLCYERTGGLKLEAYVDASFANDVDSRKSTSGFVIMLGGNVVSWISRRQSMVTLSSTEAEYVALTSCMQELIWIEKILSDFGIEIKEPIVIYEDNQACIKMVDQESFSKRTKHIDIRYHFIKEKVKSGRYELRYCTSEMQIADLLTKALPKAKVKLFRRMCGLQDINVLRANERDARIYDDRSIQDQGKDWEIVDDPEYSMEIVDGDFGTTQ